MVSRRAKAKRGFGEVDALPSGRFRARYTGPDGARHSAPITFMARIDAEGWLVDQERMISRGEWEPPRRQIREAPLLLLGEYAAAVVGPRRLRPATVALYAKLLRLTILPTFARLHLFQQERWPRSDAAECPPDRMRPPSRGRPCVSGREADLEMTL